MPSPWNRDPLLILSLAVFGVIIAVLRRAGRGWIGAVTDSLVLAGLLCTLLVLAGDWRREDQGPDGFRPVVPRFMARNGGSSDKSGAAMATDFLAGGGNGIGVTAPAKVQTHDPLVPSTRLGAVRGRARVRP
ncbi:MAG: hypothetical protein M3Y58_11560 [Chloroflexota bacterium]|nr:hypothetical protein [Chloroflexota bacterium]